LPLWLHGLFYHLKRGEIYEINDKKILTLGGALSIDKQQRTEGLSWWREELWSKDEENYCLENLDKNDWKVDYVLSHTCPDSCIYHLMGENNPKFNDPVAKFLEYIFANLDFKEWRFGHFHLDKEFLCDKGEGDFSRMFVCQYNEIKKLPLLEITDIDLDKLNADLDEGEGE
jgi:hypothetical protein